MTNLQIIYNESLAFYAQHDLENYLLENGFLPLNTYKRWQQLGYQVKKSEHAKALTRLWKLKRNVNLQEAQETQENEEATDEQMQVYFYKVNAYLFDISQVEAISNN